jgi:hypothetical protein
MSDLKGLKSFGFERFKGSIACGVQRFNGFEWLKGSIACGVQWLKGFKGFKGSIACGVQRFKGFEVSITLKENFSFYP